ncbi:MAG: septum formation initiator family protein [Bacteroidales bacterium]|nr:septum formation initiator family protein [Bacteroidales bacterium]MBR5532689.1 septum formation initiator family protein [Bacteroidales bacterium]
MKRESLKKILKILRKWWLLLAVVLFFIYLMFFDRNSIMVRMEYKHELDSLKEVLQDYKEQIKSDSMQIEELRNSRSAIEKYAREKYGYKHPDEDIFIIKKDSVE